VATVACPNQPGSERGLSLTTEELASRSVSIAARAALGVLGDREAAGDIAQEVAIIALSKSRRLRNPQAFNAWVYRVAVRRALREIKRNSRRARAEQEHNRLAPGASNEGDSLEGIARMLAPLPPRERAALTLRYVFDLPDPEIARAIRCRPGTVRSLLSRGRDRLRLTLEAQEATNA
jgi:RNA polymerase sigma-70 factor (ECF subfamily)